MTELHVRKLVRWRNRNLIQDGGVEWRVEVVLRLKSIGLFVVSFHCLEVFSCLLFKSPLLTKQESLCILL